MNGKAAQLSVFVINLEIMIEGFFPEDVTVVYVASNEKINEMISVF